MRCADFALVLLVGLATICTAHAQQVCTQEPNFRGIDVIEPIIDSPQVPGGPVEIVLGAGHRSTVWSLAFSRDGRAMVTGSLDGTVKLWDTVSGLLIRTFFGHSASVQSVAFSPDGEKI